MGTIPIISDIIDSLKWLADFFFNKLPKPLLMLVFLLFLFITAALTSIILHSVGIHCDGKNTPVKTSMLDWFGNVAIAQASHQVLTTPSYTFEQLFPSRQKSDILFYGKFNATGGVWIYCTENDTGCSYYLRAAQCYNCSSLKDIHIATTQYIGGEFMTICLTDAYYWVNPYAGGVCFYNYAKIPTHYAFNHTTGTYTCVDVDYCGTNPTKPIISQLDDQLKGMDAEMFYQNQSTRNIDHMVGITCNNYQPTVAFFGIAVLDYRIWVLLIVLWVMFTFIVNMGQQSNL